MAQYFRIVYASSRHFLYFKMMKKSQMIFVSRSLKEYLILNKSLCVVRIFHSYIRSFLYMNMVHYIISTKQKKKKKIIHLPIKPFDQFILHSNDISFQSEHNRWNEWTKENQMLFSTFNQILEYHQLQSTWTRRKFHVKMINRYLLCYVCLCVCVFVIEPSNCIEFMIMRRNKQTKNIYLIMNLSNCNFIKAQSYDIVLQMFDLQNHDRCK